MDRGELQALIEKYLTNTLSETERKRLDDWYQSFNDEVVEIPVMQETTEEDVMADLYERIKTNLVLPEQASYRARWSRSVFLKIAATFTLLVAIAGLLIMHSSALYDWLYPLQYTERVVPPGRQEIIKLADGTEVTLNANTRFRYPIAFRRNTREVFLEGEAFFKVARNVEKPFKVHTQNLVTTVLGTSFNVDATGYQHQLQVTVVTGKVQVARVDTTAAGALVKETVLGVLTPAEQLTYAAQAGATIHKQIDIDAVASWKAGVLQFHDVSLAVLVQRLKDWYGVEIHVPSHQMQDCRFSASFTHLPLDTVLRRLAAANGFTFERNGKTVWIKGGVACR